MGSRGASSRESRAGLPILTFDSAAAWEKWLAEQPRESKGIWLKLAKKHSRAPSVTKTEAVDGALCHGWIDGQVQPFDEDFWLTRFTPRSSRSKWSRNNQERAQELIESGRMSGAGREEVERAKTDGRWQAAYAPQSKATVPPDLEAALEKNRKAAGFFAELDSVNRYAILYRVQDAKRPETRANRIEKFIAMLARGETIYPLRSNANRRAK